MHRRLCCGLVTFCFLFLGGATPTRGETVFYADRAAFLEATGDLPVEGFEQPFDTARSVQFPGFLATETSEDLNAQNIKSRTDYVSAGERSMGFTWNGDVAFTFEFDPPIDAFAADILDFGTCCDATQLLVVSDTGEIDAVAGVGPQADRGNLQFFGVTTDSPFSRLTFSSDQNSTNDLIVFDEVALRAVAVPEPGVTLWFLSTVLAVIGGKRRRRTSSLRRQ